MVKINVCLHFAIYFADYAFGKCLQMYGNVEEEDLARYGIDLLTYLCFIINRHISRKQK